MTKILSWNIQNGKGCDGVISLPRIANVIREMGDPDIICLQEVSVNFTLADGSKVDQVRELDKLFPQHQILFGPAIDVWDSELNERSQFGNVILSRFPVHTVFCHPLPQPPHASVKQMPRQLVEVSLETPERSLRVMTTHLEFHSETQRAAQSKRIMDIQNEITAIDSAPPSYDVSGPYMSLNRGQSCVICGDFNFLKDSPEYQVFTTTNHSKQAVLDAWTLISSGQAQPPTCGVFDDHQWPEGAHCRDFMFVSPDLGEEISDFQVNTTANASDHQPLLLVLR